MLDRETRNLLVNSIELYLDERITAFELDEKITQLAAESKDETVHYVVRALWYHYDDCDDHTVVLSKEQWDYFQRILLLLRSDAELNVERRRWWSLRQLIAGLTLLCFLLLAMCIGLGMHLFIVAMPFGIISIILSRTHSKPSKDEQKYLSTLAPFSSVFEILAVGRSVEGFQKRRYPQKLENKRIRSGFLDLAYVFNAIVMCLTFSPFVLLFQMLPNVEEKAAVVVPNRLGVERI